MNDIFVQQDFSSFFFLLLFSLNIYAPVKTNTQTYSTVGLRILQRRLVSNFELAKPVKRYLVPNSIVQNDKLNENQFNCLHCC